ncbi:hypothetical protein CWC15_16620 [Pseudoalteromonas spongiae]|nr:hypothetical protein CWC15_16620 [Pseudoalteromonas spongiae]
MGFAARARFQYGRDKWRGNYALCLASRERRKVGASPVNIRVNNTLFEVTFTKPPSPKGGFSDSNYINVCSSFLAKPKKGNFS